MGTTQRHKVFVSFHHDDELYKDRFCRWLGNSFVDKSVEDGDIESTNKVDTIRRTIRDDFIADATVTVVLVGRCTWQRKHVDWEVGSSLRATQNNPRCGLLGILLPSHSDHGKRNFNPRLIPPRLADNVGAPSSFGLLYHWPTSWNASTVQGWIHEAFQRRNRYPDNSREHFARNRSGDCARGW